MKLRGIVPPLVTPIGKDGHFDEHAMERLVAHVTSAPVSGLFVLGTTGEGPSLDYKTRRRVVQSTLRAKPANVPLLVSVTDTSLVEMQSFSDCAAAEGADSLVVAPPYYLAPGEPEIFRWLDWLESNLPLPYYVYNMPGMTKVSISPKAVSYLVDFEKCRGFKDSSLDMIYLKKILSITKNREDFSVFVGPEELLLDALIAGADGGVNGGANVYPDLYVRTFEAFEHGDYMQARILQAKICELSNNIYSLGGYGPAVVKGIKACLSFHGVTQETLVPPFDALTEAQRHTVNKVVDDLGLKEFLPSDKDEPKFDAVEVATAS